MKYLNDVLNKDHYEAPVMEIIDFDSEDIITTSDPAYPGEPDPID